MATELETVGTDYLDSAECQQSLMPFLQYLLNRHEQQGGITEILLMPPPNKPSSKPMSGCFNPEALDTLVELLRPEARDRIPRGQHPRIGEAHVMYNPHPVVMNSQGSSPGGFARCKNTGHVDVVAFSLFAVSISPTRSGISPMAAEEREQARLIAKAVAAFFVQRGIHPISIDGGSVFQLLIPTTPYADVVKACEDGAALLRLLGQRFSTEEVQVGWDHSAEAVQVLPLPGTLLLDGDSASDMTGYHVWLCKPTMPDDVDLFGLLAEELIPFRADHAQGELLETSTVGTEVDDTVETPVDLCAGSTSSSTPHTTTRVAGTGWDAETAGRVLAGVLERSELSYRVKKKGGDKHYQFTHCPNTSDPDGRHSHECAIIVRADGTFTAKCRHDQDATWQTFRLAIGWPDHVRNVMKHLGIAPRSCPYRATDSGLIYLQRSRGRRVKRRLTNFIARIVRDVEEDDGVETAHIFEVEARLDGKVSRFPLTAAQFAAMAWPSQRLGAGAVTFPGGSNGHVRAAIQLLSGAVPAEKVYKHTGWRMHGDEHVYLHADGAIGKDGPVPGVRVDLPEQLSPYRLPPPPSGVDLRKAVAASLQVLDVAPDAVTVPLFGGIWRVAVGAVDFAEHVVGPSGSGKTALTSLYQQHWGGELDAQHLPGTWLSTANANELLAFQAKDAVVVIDDFVPSGGPSEGARQHREADRLLRAQGNSTGRGRLRSDATLQSAKPPRGLMVSTGEATPRGQSLRARLLVLKVLPGTVDWGRMTACQQEAAAGLYAAAFAAFVQWLAPRLEEVRQGMPERLAALREQATASGQHKRTPGIVANLFFGLELFSKFAVAAKALTEEQADAFLKRCWKALGEVAAAQAALQAHGEPTHRFLELLAAAIGAGKAHVAGADGNVPTNPAGLGWREEAGTWTAVGDRVGWVDGADLFLEPEVAFAVAQRMSEAGHEPLGIGAKTLHKRLHEQGHLVSTEITRGHLTIRKTLEGRVRTVLHLRADAIGTVPVADPSTGPKRPGKKRPAKR